MTRTAELLTAGPFAHRGLWSPNGPPENSLAATEAATAAGYGIELDVRLSADGEAVVFHDETLERMTGAGGAVRGRTAAELGELSLAGGSERVPTLALTLERVGGRTPILVELKARSGQEGPLERRVADLLGGYDGPAAVLGFNPAALVAVAEVDARIPRGLNLSDHVNEDADVVEARPVDYASSIGRGRPHFLSLGKALLTGGRPHHLPIVGWTIRSPAELRSVEASCDSYMFEGFRA